MNSKNNYKFDFLKSTVLADPDAQAEEVSIWLDMNVQTWHGLFNIIKCIYDNAQTKSDKLVKVNDIYRYMSEMMFRNMFKAAFISKSLDRFILDKKFLDAVKKLQSYTKAHIKEKVKGRAIAFVSNKHLDMFETLSELVERIEEQIKRS